MPNSRTCSRGCGYAITWHATHCCESCRDGHAENVHGPKCDRLQVRTMTMTMTMTTVPRTFLPAPSCR
eukprot:763926-Hanusia_phi.AAC.4